MSAISDFATRQNAANERIDTALTTIENAVTNGTTSAEDLAILNAQAVRSEAQAVRVEAVAASVTPAPPTT